MNAYFTGYRCNCTALELVREAIQSNCPEHGAEIIYGTHGAQELVEVEENTEMGVKRNEAR